jgi:hypothetical protein
MQMRPGNLSNQQNNTRNEFSIVENPNIDVLQEDIEQIVQKCVIGHTPGRPYLIYAN